MRDYRRSCSLSTLQLAKLRNAIRRAVYTPPSRRRGGCAIKKIAPFLSWRRRGGCLRPPIKRSLETTTPSAPQRMLRSIFLGRVHPSFAKEGYIYIYTRRPQLSRNDGRLDSQQTMAYCFMSKVDVTKVEVLRKCHHHAFQFRKEPSTC